MDKNPNALLFATIYKCKLCSKVIKQIYKGEAAWVIENRDDIALAIEKGVISESGVHKCEGNRIGMLELIGAEY